MAGMFSMADMVFMAGMASAVDTASVAEGGS